MKNEPIITTNFAGGTVVAGIIAFAMKMGWVHFSDAQRWIIMAVVAMVLPPVLGLISRQWVSPVGKLAPAVNAIKSIARNPETQTIIREGEQAIIDNVITHAPAQSSIAAVAVTPPAPSAPDGAPVQPATPAPAV